MGYLELDRRGAELLFQVLTEREERSAIAIASSEPFSSWAKTFTDPRLCAAIVDRLTFAGQIIETGTSAGEPLPAGVHHRPGPRGGVLAVPTHPQTSTPEHHHPHRAAGGIAGLEIVIDTREQYAYRFGTQQVVTVNRALPCGDIAKNSSPVSRSQTTPCRSSTRRSTTPLRGFAAAVSQRCRELACGADRKRPRLSNWRHPVGVIADYVGRPRGAADHVQGHHLRVAVVGDYLYVLGPACRDEERQRGLEILCAGSGVAPKVHALAPAGIW